MLDLWLQVPWWLRSVLSLGMLGLGGWVIVSIDPRVGALPFLIGLIMLIAGGRSASEKKGYRSV